MIIRKLTMKEIAGIISSCDDSNRYQTVTDIKAMPVLYEQASLTKRYFPQVDDKILQCKMWLNRGRFVSGFHYDCLENSNLQACGTKHFVLYEPGIANFYARGLFTAKGHTSEITDPDDYERERFRGFEQLGDKSHDVVLHAGEVLYLPLCWWHNVVSSGEMNLNFNFWWINTTKSLTRFPRQFLSGIITVLYRKMTNQLY